MINYNPREWVFFTWNLHKSDTIRQLFPLIVVVGLYSLGVAWLEMEIIDLKKDSYLKNVTILHSLLGFVISFLMVFRTNTAYERWWEGRKLWGALVNNSRNLAMKLAAILPERDPERAFFRKMIPAYAFVLKKHLRSEETRIELFELPEAVQKRLDAEKHLPNQFALTLIRHANELLKKGQISGEQLLFINAELQSFTDICGACERIKNTPIPYSYSTFIKKFIFFYIATLPIGLVFTLGYYVIPITVFIFYVLASLELIAEEIEEPFGGDDNDLPLEKMAHNIQVHIEELL